MNLLFPTKYKVNAQSLGFNDLKEMYDKLYPQKSTHEIAKLLNITGAAICYHLKKLKIKTRKRGGDNCTNYNTTSNRLFNCFSFYELSNLTNGELIKRLGLKWTRSKSSQVSFLLRNHLGISKIHHRHIKKVDFSNELRYNTCSQLITRLSS